MPTARWTLRAILSLGISGLFVWLSLRHTDLRGVASAMRAAPAGPLAGYFVLLLLIHLVRTVRWGLLLEPVGRVGFRRLNFASAVGFMLLVVLPLALYFQDLGLNNSYLGLVWVYQLISLPLILWIVRGYFEDMSPDIEQRISGKEMS